MGTLYVRSGKLWWEVSPDQWQQCHGLPNVRLARVDQPGPPPPAAAHGCCELSPEITDVTFGPVPQPPESPNAEA